jgi:hypothetical protein
MVLTVTRLGLDQWRATVEGPGLAERSLVLPTRLRAQGWADSALAGKVNHGGAAEDHDEEMITMTTGNEPKVVRELDKILPRAMRPTPSGARLDLRLYFTEDKDGQWLSVTVTDADDKQVGPSLPIDRPESIGPYFDALAAKAYKVAAAKRTKPLQH